LGKDKEGEDDDEERSERDWESTGGGLGRRSRNRIWRRATTHLRLDLPCAGAAHRRTSPPWPAWLPALIRRTKLSQYPVGVGAGGERSGDWPRVCSGEEWEWGVGSGDWERGMRAGIGWVADPMPTATFNQPETHL
jgi:hypothetical protein